MVHKFIILPLLYPVGGVDLSCCLRFGRKKIRGFAATCNLVRYWGHQGLTVWKLHSTTDTEFYTLKLENWVHIIFDLP